MTNFVQQFFADCQDLSNNLIVTGQNLCAAIADDIESKRRLREAEERLSNAEAELIAEAAIRAAVEKAGPLSGIAATSSAFKAACESMIAKARQAQLSRLYADAVRLRNLADEAQTIREQTATMFGAMKHAADLRAALLNAMSAQ